MIKMDVEVYGTIVNEIKNQTNNIIVTESGYVTPDAECLRNSIIPDYQQADHEVVDMLRLMKKEFDHVTGVMEAFKADYETIDAVKTADCEKVYNPNQTSKG